jgi:hypothetical protein
VQSGARALLQRDKILTAVTAEANGLALAPDGKIVVAGSIETVVTDSAGAMTQPTRFALVQPGEGHGTEAANRAHITASVTHPAV